MSPEERPYFSWKISICDAPLRYDFLCKSHKKQAGLNLLQSTVFTKGWIIMDVFMGTRKRLPNCYKFKIPSP